jgi:uncharacterized protein (TIGR02145 family)
MKKSILFLVLLQSLLIFAQAPQKMTYQSVVRNSANVLLANQAVGVRISILEGTPAAAVYSETHTVTTNANGLFTLEAGGGTPAQGVFADIAWGNGAHYIKSEIDPAGGTNYYLSATKELLSVPYALNGITTAQADAITAQATTITAMQAQIVAMQAQITFLLPTGTQVWTTKNLDVATYSDGTIIPQVTNPTQWANLTTGAWCYYNNDADTGATFGRLYNWYAVAGIWDEASKTDANQRKKLAPTGYHVPSDAEWTTLTTYLEGDNVAGGKMKATGTALWNSPNQDATNSSGFAGLPGGFRNYIGTFNNIGSLGYWWSSSEDYTADAWFRFLNYNYGSAYRNDASKDYGFSVRCLRD